ncbi:hypothetical protein [Streptomyces parvulus]|uniref:hypothetical protein n=1 Tax=Streptomyces parvulus TaxID=146923 RepID=UPI0033E8ADB0
MSLPDHTGAPDELADHTARLTTSIQRAIRPHGGLRDSLLHNGITMISMAATTAATIIPGDQSIWARISAGIATLLIAVARALDFGARWRWHLNMRSRYEVLLDRVDKVSLLPVDERRAALVQVYDDLAKVRSLERGIPGSGTASSISQPGS